jgi:hypothetical protein
MEFIGCIETVIRQNYEEEYAYLNEEKPHE